MDGSRSDKRDNYLMGTEARGFHEGCPAAGAILSVPGVHILEGWLVGRRGGVDEPGVGVEQCGKHGCQTTRNEHLDYKTVTVTVSKSFVLVNITLQIYARILNSGKPKTW